jgi:hypothetical protein
VKEGWAPLCEFLDRPVPEVPFPRMNDTKEFKARGAKMSLMPTPSCIPLAPSLLVASFWQFGGQKRNSILLLLDAKVGKRAAKEEIDGSRMSLCV